MERLSTPIEPIATTQLDLPSIAHRLGNLMLGQEGQRLARGPKPQNIILQVDGALQAREIIDRVPMADTHM